MSRTAKKEYIQVSIGDTIEAHFWHHSDANTRTQTLTVVDVTERFGRVNDGQTPMLPLIRGVNVETGEEKLFDVGFVMKVLTRSKTRHIRNIFRDTPRQDLTGKVWSGSLSIMAERVLANLPYEITRPLDGSKLMNLYRRNPVGLIRSYRNSYFYVNPDKFKRWVKQNWSKILMTTTKLDLEHTKVNRSFEHDYWNSVEASDRDSDWLT